MDRQQTEAQRHKSFGAHIAERITTEKVAEQQPRSQQLKRIHSFMRIHFLALFDHFSDANSIVNSYDLLDKGFV